MKIDMDSKDCVTNSCAKSLILRIDLERRAKLLFGQIIEAGETLKDWSLYSFNLLGRIFRLDIYKDYISCHTHGFDLKVWRECSERTFLEICCQGPSCERILFSPVSSSKFAKVFSFEYEGEKYFHKTFLSRNWRDSIKDIFRSGREERSLRGHLLLQENGFCAPRINVVGRKGSNNFMVSQAGRKISTVYQFLLQMSMLPLSKEKYSQIKEHVFQLGSTIGQLHHLGISHGDLRLGNIIIDTSDLCQSRYCFLDNERTVRYRKLPRHKRLKNLVQLNMIPESLVTKTDRMRFVKAYLQENPDLAEQKKTWLKRIIKKTQKRLLRKTQRK